MSKKLTTQEFKNRISDNIEVLEEYKDSLTKIKIRYIDCGHINIKMPFKIISGQGCSLCKGKTISKAKTKDIEHFIKQLYNNKINYIKPIGKYVNLKTKLKILNTKCNHIYEATPSNIIKGSGCPICYGYKNTESFINQINTKYPNEYIVFGEYINNRTKIKVQHKCGYAWETNPKDLLKDIRCPNCRISKGEKYIKDFLDKNNIKYESQYTFDNCKNKYKLPFDFAIINENVIKLIEFDGIQHFRDDGLYKGNKLNDNIKNEYCKNQNIKLLRIPYWWLKTDRINKELEIFTK